MSEDEIDAITEAKAKIVEETDEQTQKKVRRVVAEITRNPIDLKPQPEKAEEEKKRVVRGVVIGGLMA